jgi:divalent metal cation (Fe/Co/Zn/Cd) transporter
VGLSIALVTTVLSPLRRRFCAQARQVHLPYVAAAVVGFAGNEIVARYRIGSAALVVDGRHARTDGFTSLAVLLGVGGAAVGSRWADPVVGLLITLSVLFVLKDAQRRSTGG